MAPNGVKDECQHNNGVATRNRGKRKAARKNQLEVMCANVQAPAGAYLAVEIAAENEADVVLLPEVRMLESEASTFVGFCGTMVTRYTTKLAQSLRAGGERAGLLVG